MRFLFDRDTWQEIWGSIGKNKLRTIITIVGVLWGIFVYIALSGAAKGLDNGFDRQFKDIATNSMFVWAQRTSIPYGGFKIGRSLDLRLGDVERLKSNFTEIQYIAPRLTRGIFDGSPARTVRGSKSGSYKVFGDYPIIEMISRKDLVEGSRFINQRDMEDHRKVVVIGERVQSELFEEDENPIGSYIQIDQLYYQVIGVYQEDTNGGFDGDNSIFMPFSTFRSSYHTGDRVGWMAVAAYDHVDIKALEQKVKRALRRMHNVHPDDARAFGAFNLGEQLGKVLGFSKGINLLSLVVGIATIFAGVIAIGNILLISVKERTKEIGIRRALGASPGEIRRQIILESVVLTLIAGLIGIALGALALNGIRYATTGSEFPFYNPTVPIPFVLGAVGIMVILGSLIGLIPAQRAVSIKPIDALREE